VLLCCLTETTVVSAAVMIIWSPCLLPCWSLQAEGLQQSLEGADDLSRNTGTAGEAAPAGAASTAAAVGGGANKKIE